VYLLDTTMTGGAPSPAHDGAISRYVHFEPGLISDAVAGLAAMTAALGGIDALVFTGGIGERSAELRRRAVAGLAFLAIDIDGGANERLAALDGGGAEITGAGSRARVLVIAAREDVEIARGVRAAFSGRS